MYATLASNGSPAARRATMSNSQFQENNRLEDVKGPAHKVYPLTGTSSYTLINTLCPDSRLSCKEYLYLISYPRVI